MTPVECLHITPEDAVMAGVAYADIFHFPVRPDEVALYVPFVRVASKRIHAIIDELVASGRLLSEHGYVCLPGRHELIAKRRKREPLLERKWEQIHQYLGPLLAFSWVKAVLLTGSLAAKNPSDGADADLLLILDRRRMWIGYLVARLWCRFGKPIEFCPNYALSDRALALPFQNLFTALELGKAVVLKGIPMAEAFIAANSWADRFMPNVPPLPERTVLVRAHRGLGHRLLDWLVVSPLGKLGDWLEYYRLKWRTRGRYQPNKEVYKPHPPLRQVRIFRAWLERMDQLEIRASKLRHHLAQWSHELERVPWSHQGEPATDTVSLAAE